MRQQTIEIPISSIILDEDIYPRKGIDHKRVGMFAENIRDGFNFDPIEVESVPGKPGWYRLLDGAHRWNVYKLTGKVKVKALVQELNGMDQKTIHYHLGKMPVLANSLNADLSQGFTVAQVAQKHGWTEPMVWSLIPWLAAV